MRSLSSDEYDNEKLDEIKNIQDLIIQSDFKERRFKKSLSKKLDDFIDFNYNQINRKNLPYKLHCPDSMIKDLIKSLTSKKISFPITYNEPISMLQKQCEKFLYSDLLEKASDKLIPSELKIVYIVGFIAGELSQNINRYLKPFNPILGETFEFYDNEKKYRYFSEQVSHNLLILEKVIIFVILVIRDLKIRLKFLKEQWKLNLLIKLMLFLKIHKINMFLINLLFI